MICEGEASPDEHPNCPESSGKLAKVRSSRVRHNAIDATRTVAFNELVRMAKGLFSRLRLSCHGRIPLMEDAMTHEEDKSMIARKQARDARYVEFVRSDRAADPRWNGR